MSTPRRHHDPERAEARRCQVLDAAAGCFREHGFHGASMAEISKRAGMSAGHIYNYFASKEEIIFGIVDRNVEDVLERMQTLVDGGRDVLDVLVDRAAEGVAHNTEPAYVSLMLEVSAEAARNPAVAAKVRAADRILLGRLHELLMSSGKATAYREDPARQGRLNMLVAMFEGIRQRALACPDLDLDSLVAPMRNVIRAVLTG
ncbi:TetR/AcrR family transcriptional regulator [Uliginosibacterium sp. H1]|uniref:TetR/AcrR family transcriptional regulator n=1 Tax=Uliginosibacterium sp. H1 TaxID=3114757 RepID=UPI002E18007E|nr:TetR/AcrR family transcriptional regulator [Uliginosibacterium sp. H1]